MESVELIRRKRDGEELTQEEIVAFFQAYSRDEVPDYQVAALLMAVYLQGMTEREVSALTACLLGSGQAVDLSSVPGAKVHLYSTGGVGDKAELVAAPLAAAAGVVVPVFAERSRGRVSGLLDKLASIPGFRVQLTFDEIRTQLNQLGVCFAAPLLEPSPLQQKLAVLQQGTATEESVPLLAASIMARELTYGVDGFVFDVKVGAGSFVKRQIDGRRLGQHMVMISRRMNKRAQALITDMNQPLGYAIGNALEIMEVSQTLQNVGPADLTQLSLELAARMIYLAGITATTREAREMAQLKLADGSGYRKLREVIEAQGGNPQVLDRFELLPMATGAREVITPRSGWVTAIDAGDIAQAAGMIGASPDNPRGEIDPAVGVVLEVKVGQRVEAGSVLCRLYHTVEDRLAEAAQTIEDAFKISSQPPEGRELILEVVG